MKQLIRAKVLFYLVNRSCGDSDGLLTESSIKLTLFEATLATMTKCLNQIKYCNGQKQTVYAGMFNSCVFKAVKRFIAQTNKHWQKTGLKDME